MNEQIYNKFLSSGFAELNAGAERHMIALYRHNYKKFLPENKQARILEIGCGMGNFLSFKSKKTSRSIFSEHFFARGCLYQQYLPT